MDMVILKFESLSHNEYITAPRIIEVKMGGQAKDDLWGSNVRTEKYLHGTYQQPILRTFLSSLKGETERGLKTKAVVLSREPGNTGCMCGDTSGTQGVCVTDIWWEHWRTQ